MKQTTVAPRSAKRAAKAEKRTNIRFEDFGGRVTRAWRAMRPTTRRLVERALQANLPAPSAKNLRPNATLYDARAELELSRLLAALDDCATETDSLNALQRRNLARAAAVCAVVLQIEARSAEAFGQLIERALLVADFTRVDALCETMNARLAPAELCELARHEIAAIRALAFEALMQKPTAALVNLLIDPIDAEVARAALEGQAFEYEIEEAQFVIGALEAEESNNEI